jgi:hypothetical protein
MRWIGKTGRNEGREGWKWGKRVPDCGNRSEKRVRIRLCLRRRASSDVNNKGLGLGLGLGTGWGNWASMGSTEIDIYGQRRI